ncbi:hypothetical protein ACFXPY_40465 [Streptomyces sp. NPDC059153]|uniref:hypothetical protein n=1 Tax=unclassified Streptomyces TaxID=2593676 RepID=UPI0036CB425B
MPGVPGPRRSAGQDLAAGPFELPTGPLSEWLDATCRITSAEAEMDGLNWDDFLLELLDDPGTPSE